MLEHKLVELEGKVSGSTHSLFIIKYPGSQLCSNWGVDIQRYTGQFHWVPVYVCLLYKIKEKEENKKSFTIYQDRDNYG